jgi:tape measure domain-containing protein
MGAKQLEFGLLIRAATEEAKGKIAEIKGGLADVHQEAAKTKIDGPAKDGESAFESLSGSVKRFIAVYASIATIRALTRISDEAELIASRLKQASDATTDFAVTQGALFALAQRLGVAYSTVSQSFTRMLPIVKDLGGGVAETVKLSEILAVTARLAGASQEEAASSAIQFAQALGSQVLQGDELKSILENNQVLARALASSLGVGDQEARPRTS